MLNACGVHPTMWIRLWFDNGGRPHQRAYTLVDPDPEAGRFSLEFALHDGCAARWATAAAAGDTIEATVQGTAFTWPDPGPEHLYAVGDAASLPAINSLLDSAPDVAATVWLEYAHDDERALPVRARDHHTVTWLPRRDDGLLLVDTVRAAVPAAPAAYYWIACEAASTRTLTRHLRRELGVGKDRISSLAYWSAR
ncbi:siderophore-interacting protein [Planomonospora alba]|uniref:Siderophore-interacting protein n=1 Tax=Planomonospora alba TaxID=161354 RepID=A0ABP6N8R9_9ACTN